MVYFGGCRKGSAGEAEFMNTTGVAITKSFSERGVESPSREDIHRMFDRIARRYDFLNRLFSFGQDVVWRGKMAKIMGLNESESVLDLATGTADVLLSAFKHNRSMKLGVGLDTAGVMLQVGQMKVERAGLAKRAALIKADALALPIADGVFDATTISFGIRNVTDVALALTEMKRVLRVGGKALILEFALPSNWLMRRLFLIYLRRVIPLVGGIVSGNKRAYKYFDETVETFPYGEEFVKLMYGAGLKEVVAHRMTFGVAMIYEGTK